MENNKVKIIGTVVTEAEFAYEICNEEFYSFQVESERTSGAIDTLNVIASQRILGEVQNSKNKQICIEGEFRSRNVQVGDKRKLALFVFAQAISTSDSAQKEVNEIKLTGYLCKNPVYRVTPLGREITDIVLAVNRTMKSRADYIPCIAWGRTARFVSTLPIGTKLSITGRVQSRQYVKNEQEYTAYEVSAKFVDVLEGDDEGEN